VLDGLRVAGSKVPVVVGGIIPDGDAEALRSAGVSRVFTPKDFALSEIVAELVTGVRESNGLTA
jgi:(2R)-ethylmalonyl-CoA mutase